MRSKKGMCEAGCKAFTGGEIYHHKDCVHYPESMSQRQDELKQQVKDYDLLHNVSNRRELLIAFFNDLYDVKTIEGKAATEVKVDCWLSNL